jgi:flagellar protein FlaF
MSLQAYHKASVSAETSRETEYRLFAEVTRALMEAAKTDPTDLRGRIDALDWNRRVWTVMGQDCANPNNPLPDALKASIISLSIWVSRYTGAVIRREDDIEDLIVVNRMIMQGLAGVRDSVAAA